MKDFTLGFHSVGAHYGFMEQPDVPAVMRRASALSPSLHDEPARTTYYLGRITVVPPSSRDSARMFRWRVKLFRLLKLGYVGDMKRFGRILLGLGAVIGVGVAGAIATHLGLAGVPWLVNVALAKLGLVAAGALMAGGAVSLRLAKRREHTALPRASVEGPRR